MGLHSAVADRTPAAKLPRARRFWCSTHEALQRDTELRLIVARGCYRVELQGGRACILSPVETVLLLPGERLHQLRALLVGDEQPAALCIAASDLPAAVRQNLRAVQPALQFRRSVHLSADEFLAWRAGSQRAQLTDELLTARLGVHRLKCLEQRADCRRAQRQSKVEAVKTLLIEHIHRDLGLFELGQASGLTPYRLARSFAAETDATLRDYVCDLRRRVCHDHVAAAMH